MKIMRKSQLNQAVLAAVFAAGLSGVAQAESVTGAMPQTAADATAAGNQSVSNPRAAIVDPNGVGDVLLYPYYTTQNGHKTLFHLQNTDSTRTVIAKVRFRDYVASNDALDFTVILSPGDVYTGFVSDVNGTTTFTATDSTCSSPVIGKGGSVSFPTSTDSANKHTGHIEVITEGVISNATVDGVAASAAALGLTAVQIDDLKAFIAAAKHGSNSLPANCATVNTKFGAGASGVTALQGLVNSQTAGLGGDGADGGAVDLVAITNSLSGHYAILNAAGGYSAAGRPVAVQDFAAGTVNSAIETTLAGASGSLINPCMAADALADDLICGQIPAHYPFPNMMNVANLATDLVVGGNLTNREGMNALEYALSGPTMNEWSAKTSNGVSSEIILTQPLKYVRRDLQSVTANINNNDYYGAGYSAVVGVASATNDDNSWDDVDAALGGAAAALHGANANTDTYTSAAFYGSDGCTAVDATVTDREEGSVSSGTSVSGGTVSSTKYCNETTVVTFGGGVTNPTGAVAADYSGVNQEFGWYAAGLNDDLPTIGHAMWVRKFGTSSNNYGQIIQNTKLGN